MHYPELEKQVRAALDLPQLRRRCEAPIADLFAALNGTLEGNEAVGRHMLRDNGAGILAVAHLDTVQQISTWNKSDNLIFNPRLDDRLGVYTLLDLLPRLGVVVDVLFTENEEIGRSTAGDFLPTKDYQWMVEFDRCGTDTVTYCYDWNLVLHDYFRIGQGSFSDICYLEHLGCKGFNVGIGYQNEHSLQAYFAVDEYVAQVARFLAFYADHQASTFLHTPDMVYADVPYWRAFEDISEADTDEPVGYCPCCEDEREEWETEDCCGHVVCRICSTECMLYADLLGHGFDT